jgi:hypothetical protein
MLDEQIKSSADCTKKWKHLSIVLDMLLIIVIFQSTGIIKAQTNITTNDKFQIKGIAVDINGPIANMVVIVMPISVTLGPVIRHEGTDKNGFQLGVDATFGTERTRNMDTDKWTTKYKIGDSPVSGQRWNPETTTDSHGTFSVTVSQSLFRDYTGGSNVSTKYKVGEIGLGVFNGSVSSYEMEIIKYDVKAATIDVGRLVFKPVREQGR